MALTYTLFIERFPDFTAARDDVVKAELANAARMVNSAMFAEQTDDAVGLLAAHRVAMRPGGEFARIKMKDGSFRSTYGDEYREMLKNVVPGDRVP